MKTLLETDRTFKIHDERRKLYFLAEKITQPNSTQVTRIRVFRAKIEDDIKKMETGLLDARCLLRVCIQDPNIFEIKSDGEIELITNKDKIDYLSKLIKDCISMHKKLRSK